MCIPEKCEICKKEFKKNDNIYVAWGKELQIIFVCINCLEGK